MSLDLGRVAERFRRAGQPIPPVVGTSRPAHPGADTLAYNPVTEPEADHGRLSPPRRMAGRGPKRRRWILPGSPAERRQKAINPPEQELHPCPFCQQTHQPIPLYRAGLADTYGRSLLPDPNRVEPIGRQSADTVSLVRDLFNPWR
jgi:hypothetical protein